MTPIVRRRSIIALVLAGPFLVALFGSFLIGPAMDVADQSSLGVRAAILATISVVYAPEFLAAEAVEKFQPVDVWGASVPTQAGQRWRLILATAFRFAQALCFVLLLPLLPVLMRLGKPVRVLGRPTAFVAWIGTAFVLAGLLACGGYAAFCGIAESTSIGTEIALN
ncbi:MAG: hypothetical protein RL885_24490 [Planctomycetota bacterium]